MRAPVRAAVGGGAAAAREMEAMRAGLEEARGQVEGLEKERDFYFAKVSPHHSV